MNLLPNEILILIYSFLNPTDLYSVSQTCHLNNYLIFDIILRQRQIKPSNKDKRILSPYLKSLIQLTSWQLLNKAIEQKNSRLVSVLVKHTYISFKTVIKAIKSQHNQIAQLVASKFIQKAMYFFQGQLKINGHITLANELLYIDKLLQTRGINLNNGKIRKLKESAFFKRVLFLAFQSDVDEFRHVGKFLDDNFIYQNESVLSIFYVVSLDLLSYDQFSFFKSLFQSSLSEYDWIKNTVIDNKLFFPEPLIIFDLLKSYPDMKFNPFIQQLIN